MKLNFVLLYIFVFLFHSYTQAQLQWSYLPNAPVEDVRYEDVFFLNDTVGWAVSLNRIIHTSDGGNSWDVEKSDGVGYRSVKFLNDKIGFAGTLNKILFETTDGGQTWDNITKRIPDTLDKSICGMYRLGSNTLYAVGAWYGSAHFYFTHDTGATWGAKDMRYLANGLVECLFLDSLAGFASGQSNDSTDVHSNQGIILKTLDGGQTWQTVFKTGRPGELVWKMRFVDSLNGFASIENILNADSSFIAKTTDGGQTWVKKLVTVNNINMEGMGFNDTLHGWVGGYTIGMYETNDGGDTWSYLNFGVNLNRIFFLRPGFAYAAGTSIYQLNNESSGAGIQEVPLRSGYMPHQLLPVYPDPFQSPAIIRWQLTEPTVAKLDVYDVQGKWIQNLHTGQSAPGNYSATWNCDKCASGEYIIVLGTNQRYLSERVQLLGK